MRFCSKGNYMTQNFTAGNTEIKLTVCETEDFAQIVTFYGLIQIQRGHVYMF